MWIYMKEINRYYITYIIFVCVYIYAHTCVCLVCVYIYEYVCERERKHRLIHTDSHFMIPNKTDELQPNVPGTRG